MDAAERREAVKRRLQAKAETQSKRDAIYKSLENQRLAEMNKALGGKQMMTGTMKCPPDAKPGSKRMCKLPDGREIEVEIPPYAKEGVEFVGEAARGQGYLRNLAHVYTCAICTNTRLSVIVCSVRYKCQ